MSSSAGVLKQVDLVHQVTDISDVPYLNLGQEIQGRKNLVRYYKLLGEVKGLLAGANGFATTCPLQNSSYINILVDSPDEDYNVPRFLTFHSTSQKLARFGTDIDQELLNIEQDFSRVIKKIRAELGIEGDAKQAIPIKRLGLGNGEEVIPLNPREPSKFIEALYALFPAAIYTGVAKGYPIDLPYFR